MTGIRGLLWLTLLLVSTSACADTLRLAGNAWPPYSDQRLPEGGLSVDLVRTALGRAGYQVHYIEVPWERALLGLKGGTYDLLSGWPATKRAGYVRSARPFLSNRMRWVKRTTSDIHYDGLDSLIPHRIALSRGYSYNEALENHPRLKKGYAADFVQAAKMVVARKGYAADFVQAAKMVVARRVDLTLEDERTALFHFSRELEHVSGALDFVPGEFTLLDLSLVVRNSHPQQARIIEAFNREIAAMVEDGSYAAIFMRHGLPVPDSIPGR